MTTHKYTIDEINKMRRCVVALHTPTAMLCDSLDYDQIERELRTFMINGTTLDELMEHIKNKK